MPPPPGGTGLCGVTQEILRPFQKCEQGQLKGDCLEGDYAALFIQFVIAESAAQRSTSSVDVGEELLRFSWFLLPAGRSDCHR